MSAMVCITSSSWAASAQNSLRIFRPARMWQRSGISRLEEKKKWAIWINNPDACDVSSDIFVLSLFSGHSRYVWCRLFRQNVFLFVPFFQIWFVAANIESFSPSDFPISPSLALSAGTGPGRWRTVTD